MELIYLNVEVTYNSVDGIHRITYPRGATIYEGKLYDIDCEAVERIYDACHGSVSGLVYTVEPLFGPNFSRDLIALSSLARGEVSDVEHVPGALALHFHELRPPGKWWTP